MLLWNLLGLIVMDTVATDRLSPARWASLDIATSDVVLVLENAAITAGMTVGPPIVVLMPVPNASVVDPVDLETVIDLGCLNSLGPTFDHPLTAILDELRICHRLATSVDAAR